jgi:glutaredoxin
MKRIVLAVALGCAAASAFAQLYRWTDEQGRTRYTDTPPPPSAKGVQKKQYNTGTGEAGLPYATQRAVREYPVVLYTAPECGKPCADGKSLLERRGIPYREIVAREAPTIEEMRSKTGQKQVPALLVGADAIGGFEAGAWHRALTNAGYPSAAAEPVRPAAGGSTLPQVKLYTNSECKELCDAARQLLTGRKVPYKEVSVEDEASFAELKKISGGMSVPVLLVGQTVQKGYEPATYQRLLDAAGYPKTAQN